MLTLLAGAISAASAPLAPLTIPAPKIYGVSGQQFEMAFLTTPSTCRSNGQCGAIPSTTLFPQWLLSTRNWQTDGEWVQVWTLVVPLTGKGAVNYLADNSPMSDVPTTLFEGHPAVRVVRPCLSPDGRCTGYDGEVEVVVGSTMYTLFITGFNRGDTVNLLDSFRIIG